MFTIRHAEARGEANFGWLHSRHSFSFGSYYDEANMGHSALRVINDDAVTPGAGFATHGHRDMEIVSYVLEGAMEHKDSMGNVQYLPKGEFQLMSAGKGITHSEYNASKTEGLKFLQIWIVPEEQGGIPGYQQKRFTTKQGLTPIISPSGKDGTLKIKQQASMSQLIMAPDTEQVLELKPSGNAYIHQISGQLELNGQTIGPGDGVKIAQWEPIVLRNKGTEAVNALVFTLP
jgi:redox-sensitive bicupin YhaK (pirin superfamily)